MSRETSVNDTNAAPIAAPASTPGDVCLSEILVEVALGDGRNVVDVMQSFFLLFWSPWSVVESRSEPEYEPELRESPWLRFLLLLSLPSLTRHAVACALEPVSVVALASDVLAVDVVVAPVSFNLVRD